MQSPEMRACLSDWFKQQQGGHCGWSGVSTRQDVGDGLRERTGKHVGPCGPFEELRFLYQLRRKAEGTFRTQPRSCWLLS